MAAKERNSSAYIALSDNFNFHKYTLTFLIRNPCFTLQCKLQNYQYTY